MRQMINIMKALSGETRLRILNLLLERECCIYEVTQTLGISQPQASHDLSKLYDVGILKRRREGVSVIYSVDTLFHSDIIGVLKEVFENNKVAEMDRVRLQQIEHLKL